MATQKSMGEILQDLERCERLLADTHTARDRVEIHLARLVGEQAQGFLNSEASFAFKSNLEYSFREHTANIRELRRLIAQYIVDVYSVGGAMSPDIEWMDE